MVSSRLLSGILWVLTLTLRVRLVLPPTTSPRPVLAWGWLELTRRIPQILLIKFIEYCYLTSLA